MSTIVLFGVEDTAGAVFIGPGEGKWMDDWTAKSFLPPSPPVIAIGERGLLVEDGLNLGATLDAKAAVGKATLLVTFPLTNGSPVPSA